MPKFYDTKDTFTDSAAEYALLSAVRADPELLFRLKDSLPSDAFPTYGGTWHGLSAAIEGKEPLPALPESPAMGFTAPPSDPVGLADHLATLTRSRRLTALYDRLGAALYGGTLTDPTALATELAEGFGAVASGFRESDMERLQWASGLLPKVLADAAARRESGRAVQGLQTGLAGLDTQLNGLTVGITLLGGGPGMGKTAAAFQWAEHVARVEGVPTVYVTFENSPQNLVERLLASKAGGSLESIARGTIGEANLKQAANDLTQTLHRVAIIEGTSRLTVAGLKGKVRQAMNTCATTRALVVVDYLQLWAKASKELAGRRDVRERVEVLGAELREMATALGVPVLALSSLNRDAGGYGKGNSKATLDALKESGDLEYMADVVLLLNQGEAMVTTPNKSVELTIAKNRNGATGTVSLIFHPNKMTFTEGKKVTEW